MITIEMVSNNRSDMIQAKTIFLHIGSWKTGTTAIQSYLSRNADRLREAGILYPQATRQIQSRMDTAHHRLRQVLDDADGRLTRDVETLLSLVNAELRKTECDTLLISSETFMGFHRPETLARYFVAEQIIVLVGLRPQAEFLNAMYYTEVCHLKVLDLPFDYLAGFDQRKLDYVKALDRWQSVWPNTEIRASLFQGETDTKRFPVQAFLRQIGLDWQISPQENIVEHRTLPAQATMLLRQLAASGYSDDDFFRIFQILHANHKWFSPIVACFSPNILREIENNYAMSNKRLIRKYLPNEGEVYRMALQEQGEWEDIMMPLDRHLPEFVRHIARAAAE